jgi:hypothetical protein
MAASKSPRLRLLHIRDEIDGVTAALKSVTFAEYQKSYMLPRAVERARRSPANTREKGQFGRRFSPELEINPLRRYI